MPDVFDQASGDVFDQISPRSQASPIPPPGIPQPKVNMREQYLVGGDDVQPLSKTIGDMGKGMIRNAGQVSTPGMAISMMKSHAPNVELPSVLKRNTLSEKELPSAIMENALPMMMGADELPKNSIPKPPTPEIPPSTEGGIGSRLAEVAKRRIGNLPGIKAAKDANYVLRGDSPSAPTPKPEIAKPIPETNGVQWGTGGVGPIEQRGKMIPAAEPEPVVPAAIPKAEVTRTLDKTLPKALGNEPPPAIRPGVKIRDQFKPAIPEPSVQGHVPVESSAVKSFKYDPGTKQLEVAAKSGGEPYVYAEVTPAEADAFKTADSKGTAWKQIRDNHVQIGKAGEKGITPRIPDRNYRSASPEDDMTADLEKSVDIAKKKKQ